MTEYMKEMRRLVGKRPIFQCGASLIIFKSNNQVLMMRRTDNNCWCFPGGSLELGEKAEETAVREAKEETGLYIDAKDLKLFNVFSGKDLYYKYPNGDEVYNIDIVYITDRFYGNMETSDESREIRFFDMDKLPLEISPPVVPVVNMLKERFYNSSNE